MRFFQMIFSREYQGCSRGLIFSRDSFLIQREKIKLQNGLLGPPKIHFIMNCRSSSDLINKLVTKSTALSWLPCSSQVCSQSKSSYKSSNQLSYKYFDSFIFSPWEKKLKQVLYLLNHLVSFIFLSFLGRMHAFFCGGMNRVIKRFF